MTEPPRKRRKRPSPLPVVAGSLASFLGLFTLMAVQLHNGNDPALGNQAAAVVAPPAKRVVVKRIERRVSVTRVLPPKQAPVVTAAPVQVAAAPSAPAVQSAPAPAPAPAPVVQPAPVPAPAPVVTRSS